MQVRRRALDVFPTWLLKGVTGLVGVGVFAGLVYAANRFPITLPVSWPVALGLLFGAAVAASLGTSIWDRTDVLALVIKGEIQRETSGFEDGVDAAAAVEAVEEADAEDDHDALFVHLNTQGGAVGPSEDIRRAVDEFDGPVVGYAEDTCASGGYLIATACDYVVAHPDALVGSIGVILPHMDLSELASEHGVDYEAFTTGEYKDTGHPLKPVDDGDKAYLQSIVDANYERFVNRVAESRSLSPTEVRNLEARVFPADEAETRGLVDRVGTAEDAKEALANVLEREPDSLSGTETQPGSSGPLDIGAQAQRVAYAFGAGLSSKLSISADDLAATEWRFR
jgi:protease-4